MSPARTQQMRRLRQIRDDILRLRAPSAFEALVDLDLTFAQFKCILFLYGRPPQMMSAIAEVLRTSLPAATGMMDRLVNAGLVQRHSDSADRRVVLCEITENAESLIQSKLQAWSIESDGLLEYLDDRELQAVAVGLNLLYLAALKAHDPARLSAAA